jgi:hypothetical protein
VNPGRGFRSLLRAALEWSLACLLAAGALGRPASHSPVASAALAAQAETARHALSQPVPAPAVLLVAAALDGSSHAFVGDVRLADTRLRALAPQMASLRLGNGGAPRDWPAASPRNLAAAFEQAGRLLHAAPPGRPRLAVVLLSSHGDVGHLALEERRSGRLQRVSAAQLRRWLSPLAGVPTLVVVSACHSGSLIPALRGPQRIVMAAARSDRSSFGCETESNNTYFVDELFRTLQPGLSIQDWFAAAAASVGERERRMQLSPPSEPQLDVGGQMREAARRPIAELLGAPVSTPKSEPVPTL